MESEGARVLMLKTMIFYIYLRTN